MASTNEMASTNQEASTNEMAPTCAVCLESVQWAHNLECGHVFCAECLETWRRMAKTCPTCKQNSAKVIPLRCLWPSEQEMSESVRMVCDALQGKSIEEKMDDLMQELKTQRWGPHSVYSYISNFWETGDQREQVFPPLDCIVDRMIQWVGWDVRRWDPRVLNYIPAVEKAVKKDPANFRRLPHHLQLHLLDRHYVRVFNVSPLADALAAAGCSEACFTSWLRVEKGSDWAAGNISWGTYRRLLEADPEDDEEDERCYFSSAYAAAQHVPVAWWSDPAKTKWLIRAHPTWIDRVTDPELQKTIASKLLRKQPLLLGSFPPDLRPVRCVAVSA